MFQPSLRRLVAPGAMLLAALQALLWRFIHRPQPRTLALLCVGVAALALAPVATPALASGTAPTAAIFGTALQFDGSTTVVNVGGQLDNPELATSAWIYYSGGSSINTIVGNKQGGCTVGRDGWALYVNSWNTTNRTLNLEWGNGTSGCNSLTSPVTPRTCRPARLWASSVSATSTAGPPTSSRMPRGR